MLVIVRGRELPGRDCGRYRNVHVALQVRDAPHAPVPGDAASAEWHADVTVVERDGGADFHGPAVHGKPGERFLYLTWGEVDGETFRMFRRAKLMLTDLGPAALAAEAVSATVRLTDECGMPRCARLRPPAIEWAVDR